MELLVLKKENETYSDIFNKLVEEVMEIKTEIEAIELEVGEKEKLIAETLDVIQVCIGLLDKLSHEGVNIRKAIEKHNLKLLQRGWRYKKVLYIDVD
ncbi:hypothetical protein ABG79_02165 [Caloramator mitchellensis]|uniref:Phosphoribosyl-ATP pyrophosphohydrolase n=1 Tax=Caloramator mitchellensis TaxID=908809 RepID=A0A0R3JRE4_CALMK|nr:hypothetical protein [Caloramator mitchellensis]KRQ86033.1 hypothetical protein ABG79_02165 [Caloramator mitchellensis]